MNTTTKAIVGVTAAAAIAAGVYFATSSPDDSVYVPDIYVPEVYVPEIPVVDVYVPTIEVFNPTALQVAIPEIKEFMEVSDSLVFEDTDNVVNVKEVYVKGPATVSTVKEGGLDTPKSLVVTVSEPTVKTYNKDLSDNVTFFSKLKKFIKDPTVLYGDKTISRKNPVTIKWLNIFKANEKYTFTFSSLETNLKIVAEVHSPIDAAVLNDNLEFYASKGFNGVLLTFGYTNEVLSQLEDVVDLIKSKNMKVFISYSGPESLDHSLLPNPDILFNKITTLAAKADGIVLGWRRTSAHMYIQDVGFTNFIISTARKANPNIAVIGEAYYGENHKTTGNFKTLEYNIPKNSSAVLITGLGFNRISVNSVVNNLLVKIKGYNRIVLIVGDRPYYNTKNNTNKSFDYNFNIKEAIAKRWIKAGVNSVIILHGDGSDGIYNKNYTDNLATTKY